MSSVRLTWTPVLSQIDRCYNNPAWVAIDSNAAALSLPRLFFCSQFDFFCPSSPAVSQLTSSPLYLFLTVGQVSKMPEHFTQWYPFTARSAHNDFKSSVMAHNGHFYHSSWRHFRHALYVCVCVCIHSDCIQSSSIKIKASAGWNFSSRSSPGTCSVNESLAVLLYKGVITRFWGQVHKNSVWCKFGQSSSL